MLTQPLEHAHQLAVQHSGRDGIELTGDGGHRCLVDQAEALADIAGQDHRVRLGHPADGGRRRVADLSHRDRTAGPVTGGMYIADHQPVVALDDRKPGVRRSLLEPLEQSLRTPCPAADRGHQRGIHQQVEGDPSRRIGRRERIAGPHRLRMRAFPGLDRDIEMARGVRHLGEPGQVVAGESVLLVHLDEQTERTRPVTGCSRVASLLQQLRFGPAVHLPPPAGSLLRPP